MCLFCEVFCLILRSCWLFVISLYQVIPALWRSYLHFVQSLTSSRWYSSRFLWAWILSLHHLLLFPVFVCLLFLVLMNCFGYFSAGISASALMILVRETVCTEILQLESFWTFTLNIYCEKHSFQSFKIDPVSRTWRKYLIPRKEKESSHLFFSLVLIKIINSCLFWCFSHHFFCLRPVVSVMQYQI